MSYLLQRVSARHLSRQLLGSLEALGHAVAASPELHEEVLRRLVRPRAMAIPMSHLPRHKMLPKECSTRGLTVMAQMSMHLAAPPKFCRCRPMCVHLQVLNLRLWSAAAPGVQINLLDLCHRLALVRP